MDSTESARWVRSLTAAHPAELFGLDDRGCSRTPAGLFHPGRLPHPARPVGLPACRQVADFLADHLHLAGPVPTVGVVVLDPGRDPDPGGCLGGDVLRGKPGAGNDDLSPISRDLLSDIEGFAVRLG
jgi:hypothetical protein